MTEAKKRSEMEKPLTRKDVLKLIAEHGGPEGLDLSDRNLEGIDLSGEPDKLLDLEGIILVKANIQEANLQEANLLGAKLQGALLMLAKLQGACLMYANLQEANLQYANLQGADLTRADLSKTILDDVKITYDTRLDGVYWGPKYILRDEELRYYKNSEYVYRTLKWWHTQAGIYHIADQFHYREWAVKRKGLRWRKNPLQKLWNWVFCILCGYGGRPGLVVFWAVVIISGLAGIYSSSTMSLLDSFYHSAVSFTALGYGLGTSTPEIWVKGLGAFEAFIGVFMMALFLITFVRKMVR